MHKAPRSDQLAKQEIGTRKKEKQAIERDPGRPMKRDFSIQDGKPANAVTLGKSQGSSYGRSGIMGH